MNVRDFLELFFIIAAGLAMPFIVIGTYFSFVSPEERTKPLTIFFLIISILYALTYSYFSWKSIQKSKSWERIMKEEKKGREGKE